MIPVTKPYLPSLEKYHQHLLGIWEREWLTNNGPLVKEFESKLKLYLGCNELSFVTNGTIALQIAIKALNISGEIITTPFSFVATTSSIVWEGCIPVFVDIDKETLNIDAGKIEAAISPNTKAILATHCFGNACDIEAIEVIAKKHNLKVIYDAAHCFGTTYKGKSIFSYGDICTTSFHATKLMHSVEGGAIFANKANLLKRVNLMRNFGHDGPSKFSGIGINGKNSELHAAMGLSVLEYIDEILLKRKAQCDLYDTLLKGLDNIRRPTIQEECGFNHAYYPIIFNNESQTLKAIKILENENIFPRRYFYPSLSRLNYIKSPKTPIADNISSTILCLPLYHELEFKDQNRIINILSNS